MGLIKEMLNTNMIYASPRLIKFKRAKVWPLKGWRLQIFFAIRKSKHFGENRGKTKWDWLWSLLKRLLLKFQPWTTFQAIWAIFQATNREHFHMWSNNRWGFKIWNKVIKLARENTWNPAQLHYLKRKFTRNYQN